MTAVSLELEQMHSAAEQACKLMKVLSNPDRLMILCQLSKGELKVGEIEEMLGISQPTLSQQLTVLRDEELVNTRREGKSIYYRLESPKALAVSWWRHLARTGLRSVYFVQWPHLGYQRNPWWVVSTTLRRYRMAYRISVGNCCIAFCEWLDIAR
jgi:DNA-binding transcriptional ArsR family regulator